MDYTIECSNIYFILCNLDEHSKKKIPQDVYNFFDENRDKNYDVKINLNKSIYEQNLDDNTVSLLGEIYQKYLCSDEEKLQFIRQKNNVSTMYSSGYDYSNIFKNNSNSNIKVSEIDIESNELIVQEEKNIFEKIICKIKKILKII